MKELVVVMIGLSLGWITIQDFLERRISLVVLAVLFVLCSVHCCLASRTGELFLRITLNSLFAGTLLVSGTLLVKVRRPEVSVSSLIGAGDFLFLIAISPMFAFESYLVFLITSITIALVVSGILILIRQRAASDPIPLAGIISSCLVIFLILDRILREGLAGTMNITFAMVL